MSARRDHHHQHQLTSFINTNNNNSNDQHPPSLRLRNLLLLNININSVQCPPCLRQLQSVVDPPRTLPVKFLGAQRSLLLLQTNGSKVRTTASRLHSFKSLMKWPS